MAFPSRPVAARRKPRHTPPAGSRRVSANGRCHGREEFRMRRHRKIKIVATLGPASSTTFKTNALTPSTPSEGRSILIWLMFSLPNPLGASVSSNPSPETSSTCSTAGVLSLVLTRRSGSETTLFLRLTIQPIMKFSLNTITKIETTLLQVLRLKRRL